MHNVAMHAARREQTGDSLAYTFFRRPETGRLVKLEKIWAGEASACGGRLLRAVSCVGGGTHPGPVRWMGGTWFVEEKPDADGGREDRRGRVSRSEVGSGTIAVSYIYIYNSHFIISIRLSP